MNSQSEWETRYRQYQEDTKLYPTEWVVRTLKGGSYPDMKLDKSKYVNSNILDLGCGDGRNISLLNDLGFKVHATEISQEIVNMLDMKQHAMHWQVDFKVGSNQRLPYNDGYFDYVLSCASFYYMDQNDNFTDVMKEIHRVIKNDGYFIANIPDHNNSVVKDGEECEDGSILIQNDPFNIRNGARFMIARSKNELTELLTPFFKNIRIGYLFEDYYGLIVSGFVFVCQKR